MVTWKTFIVSVVALIQTFKCNDEEIVGRFLFVAWIKQPR